MSRNKKRKMMQVRVTMATAYHLNRMAEEQHTTAGRIIDALMVAAWSGQRPPTRPRPTITDVRKKEQLTNSR